jgi:rubrerythrin
MEREKQVSKLRDLAQLDVDAISLYEEAINRITIPLISERIAEFRVDHLRHVQDLSEEIIKLGGRPVENAPDVKGTLLRGFTALTSMMGNQAAVMAMIGNEELTNRSYESALKLDWSPSQRALIEKNYADEKRHLAWLKSASKQKLWETEASDATSHT